MQATCRITGMTFEISDKEVELCKQLNLPLPTLCPEEGLRQLTSSRNEWSLYKRKCDATGDAIISAYAADSPYTVYKNEIWWGDSWDALDYGRDFDFSRPFFEQYQDLQKVVPREGTSVFRSENCDYNGHTRESRNCYLNSLVYRGEDVYYSYWINKVQDSLDCYLLLDSSLCYWAIDSLDCYSCNVIQECNNCADCHFSYQLRGCKSCLFSNNLANKEYYIFNKPHSREEFEQKKKEIFNGSYEKFQESMQQFRELKAKAVHRFVNGINCENSTGDHIANLKNCENCFESYTCEDCENSISSQDSRDVINCYSAGWPGCDRIYNSVVTRGSSDIAFCIYTFFSSNLRYCDSSNELHDSFGCIGLQHKRNCILNKQYSKAEYDALLPKIIEHMKSTGEWGQFFPPALNCFAYNEAASKDYFPLAREEALKLGYKWREKDKKEYLPSTISVLPDNIADLDEKITEEILACQQCKKNYKIHPREFNFYKKQGLPIPRSCPSCRHQSRSEMRNPLRLFPRSCDKCAKEILSSYESSRPEIVYCEKCYQDSTL